MATNNEATEQVYELIFPFKGMDKSVSNTEQIPQTTPFIQNVRLRDAAKNRVRGAKRAGQSKVFAEQAGQNRPVIKMVMITNTFIPPVA
jgi:hypothetical protein